MARKKIIDKEDLDLTLLDGDDDNDDVDDSPLDPLFQNYFTPDVPDDEDAPENETFLEAVNAENEALLTDLERADRHHLTATRKRVGSGMDTNYFLCVVFVSAEQKKAFLEASGWAEYGGHRYLNGVQMARDMGIELPDGYLATDASPDKTLSEFVRKES